MRTSDTNLHLEQQLSYRVHAYLHDARGRDEVFTLPGLRGWMLSQVWPAQAPSPWFELLAVLTWTAICTVDDDPEQEVVVRGELGRQLDFLHDAVGRPPASLDVFRAEQTRHALYANLRKAADPGASRRVFHGLPRFDPTRPNRN